MDGVIIKEAVENGPIEKLPTDIMRQIFSYFSTEDKILCLEKVCQKWKESMVYSEMQILSVGDVHRKLCRRGSSCKIDFFKRYQITFRKQSKVWLLKLLNTFVSRCATVVTSVDISGFPVDDTIVEALQQFPRLNQLNISKCEITESAAATMAMFRLERISMEGGEIDGELLQNWNVQKICLSQKISYDWLPNKITTLEVRTLGDEADLKTILVHCHELKSFHVMHPHSIKSVAVIDALKSTNHGLQLTALTLALNPNTFSRLCVCCPNLTELKLRATQDRFSGETDLSFLLSLNKLEKFHFSCRWLNEFNLMNVLLNCRQLKQLDIVAKKVTEFSLYDIKCENGFDLNLEVMKLSLDCITVTTRMTAMLMNVCRNLKGVKLMKNKMKEPFLTEHSISDDAFCAEYNEAVYCSKKLRYLSLPCLVAEKNSQFLEYLSQTSVEKLYIYGGCFYFEENDIPKFSFYTDLTSLMLGPYFQNLNGLENLLPRLTNLRRLSLFVDACTSDLLNVIGSLKSLRVIELRGCGRYFMETLDIEMIPLLNSREDLRGNDGYLSPLFVNIFVKRSDYPPVPRQLELQFDNLVIRFKVFFQ